MTNLIIPLIQKESFRDNIEKANSVMASVDYCFTVRMESYNGNSCKEFRELSDRYKALQDEPNVKAIKMIQDYYAEYPYASFDLLGETLLTKILNFK